MNEFNLEHIQSQSTLSLSHTKNYLKQQQQKENENENEKEEEEEEKKEIYSNNVIEYNYTDDDHGGNVDYNNDGFVDVDGVNTLIKGSLDWRDYLESSNLVENITNILWNYATKATTNLIDDHNYNNGLEVIIFNNSHNNNLQYISHNDRLINKTTTIIIIIIITTTTTTTTSLSPYLNSNNSLNLSHSNISLNNIAVAGISGGGAGGAASVVAVGVGVGVGVNVSGVGGVTDSKLSNYTNVDNWTHTCTDVYLEDGIHSTSLEFWVCGIVLNVVGILGIIGNIISMIILSRPQMRSSINYLLIGLARCDTVLIITSMLLFGIPSIYPHTGYLFSYYNNIYPFISPLVYPIAMIAQTSSIYMTFTVTLERYVAVCHPLRARALCTYGRAKIYFIVCILFAIIYNLPRFWEVLTISYKPDNSDILLHCVRPSELRRNPTYINTYIHWCYLIINYIIPFLTLAILNCLIYRQVKRANRERQRLSRSEKREIGLATMLLCVVIVFFLFNFLALVLNISEAFYNIIHHSLTKISNLLVTINSSANFLIYVIFGEKFKRIFLLIFFKRRLSRDQPDLIHYESSISNNGDGTLNNHRSSGRFSRHGTQRSTSTYLNTNNSIINNQTTSTTNTQNSVRLTQSTSTGVVKIKRNRAPSPGPIVYYPARNMQRTTTNPLILNNNTSLDCDWVDVKNLKMTSGF